MALGVPECESSLVRRAWTKAERRVVINGLFGRLLIAIEPLICTVVFGALTVGLIFFRLPAGTNPQQHRDAAVVLSPIFGLAASAFLVYAIAVLVPPIRALLQTFSPIYIVDGYLRYRRPDRHTEADSNGYIAVLNEDRRTIAEWPSMGEFEVPESLRPALIEFSVFGGIHRIDGRSTGVVPESLPSPGGIGANLPRR
jgi:hypothetical protein